MKYIILLLSLLCFGCATERQLYNFEELEVNPELSSELQTETAPKPNLPPVWRGRKLFTSPWAYIYAKDKESASYAYDQLAEQVENSEKTETCGIIIVSGSHDSEIAFEYEKIKQLYENYISSKKLLEGEKQVFETDLKKLNKIENFHTKLHKKADEKKNENELKRFKKSVDHIITCTTFFIQPEIMQDYMKAPIDNSVYWCAFLSVDDTIDKNLDGMVSAILEDYNASAISKGLVWTIISPMMFFHKRKIIKKNQESFADGYQKNALLNKGIVKFSDKVAET